MQIEIKLNQANGRLSTREPFFIADNDELELVIKSSTKFSELIISAKNGEVTATLKYKDKPIAVPKQLCVAGYIEMRCAVISKGQTIKELDIEPIAICEVLKGFEGHAEFEQILAQQAELSKALNALAKTMNERQAATNQAIEALAAVIDNGKVL